MTRARQVGAFKDESIIYYSKADGHWIGHSLRTDQIGVGECVVEALEHLIRAVQWVIEDARKDNSLRVLRKAPPEIQEKKKHAEKLPGEIYDIAYKRVHGKWPKEVKPEFNLNKNHKYLAECNAA